MNPDGQSAAGNQSATSPALANLAESLRAAPVVNRNATSSSSCKRVCVRACVCVLYGCERVCVCVYIPRGYYRNAQLLGSLTAHTLDNQFIYDTLPS